MMTTLKEIVVCPSCHNSLFEDGEQLRCNKCSSSFGKNVFGYFEFFVEQQVHKIDSTNEQNAEDQEFCNIRTYNEYIIPFLRKEPAKRVLDAGCGLGRGIAVLIEEGYDAYGIDLPNLSEFWFRIGSDPAHCFCCDVVRLPFRSDFFDAVISTSVIEHLGTLTGHCSLVDNYPEIRHQHAKELLRVTKPSGRILISCPNKSFPIDIHHGPTDEVSPKKHRVRRYIFEKTGMNIHPIWGKYHLVSYPEVKRLFCEYGGATSCEPLSLKDFLSLKTFESTPLKPLGRLAKSYLYNLPKCFRASFMNPYVLVQIRK
jgi:SAM-dependent methyltransferase